MCRSRIRMTPNIPYVGNVVLLQDGATATFHLAHLSNMHVAPADESAAGCPTHHAHRWLLPSADSTYLCRVNEEFGTLAFVFAARGGGGQLPRLEPIMSHLLPGRGRNVTIGTTRVFVLNDFLEWYLNNSGAQSCCKPVKGIRTNTWVVSLLAFMKFAHCHILEHWYPFPFTGLQEHDK